MASRTLADRHQVVAALLVRSDAVLLCHRSVDREWYPDLWDLPGGHIEGNETPVDALVRELREELGLTFPEPLGHHSFHRVTEEFEMRAWVIRRWTGTPSNCAPHEHDEIGWFTPNDVLSLRLAEPGYSSWITEALASEDVGSPTTNLREVKRRRKMTTPSDDIPVVEEPDPLVPEDAGEIAPLDSEVDFDDGQEEDQLPLDETEAAEAGVLLDDPEALSDEEE